VLIHIYAAPALAIQRKRISELMPPPSEWFIWREQRSMRGYKAYSRPLMLDFRPSSYQRMPRMR